MHIPGQKFFLLAIVEPKDQGTQIINPLAYAGPGILIVGNRDPSIIDQRISIPFLPQQTDSFVIGFFVQGLRLVQKAC